MKNFIRIVAPAAAVLSMAFIGAANAATVDCNTNPLINYMTLDAPPGASCLDSGTGNITGNPSNDPFLTGGGTAAGYVLASKDDAANPFNIQTKQDAGETTHSGHDDETGDWSIDGSFWNTNTSGAIGFKFGTGNKPDEWFVFELTAGATSGDWTFHNIYGNGGGLSHTNLYGIPGTGPGPGPTPAPAPTPLALIALGLVGIAFRGGKSK